MAHYDFEKGAARETLCRLLAACYYEPGPEFAEERIFDSMRDAASRIEPLLATRALQLGDAFKTERREHLLVDYARLFLGPPRAIARPYESAWTGGEDVVMKDSTLSVLKLYEEGGLEIDQNFRELPDHIAAELEFFYLLLFRENQLQRSGQREQLAALSDLRGRFLQEHLGAWAAPFAAAVVDGAETAFYRELADLTQHFVSMETGRSLS